MYFDNVRSNIRISLCSFVNNSAIASGGAIYFYQTGNIDLEKNVFSSNTANIGGSLYYYEDGNSQIAYFYIYYIAFLIENIYSFKISNNSFSGNKAIQCGGAIKFDLLLPLDNLYKTNEFRENESPYGLDMASYPIRIRIIAEITNQSYFDSFVSNIQLQLQNPPGIAIPIPLTFDLMDHFGQIVITESSR